MAYIKVTIDGDTVIDGESGSWEQRTPDFIAKQLHDLTSNPNPTPPSPWMRALMLVIAEAAMTSTYTEVDIKTTGSGWSLTTKYAIELGS
jgi:hypothetical protein